MLTSASACRLRKISAIPDAPMRAICDERECHVFRRHSMSPSKDLKSSPFKSRKGPSRSFTFVRQHSRRRFAAITMPSTMGHRPVLFDSRILERRNYVVDDVPRLLAARRWFISGFGQGLSITMRPFHVIIGPRASVVSLLRYAN